ncbi:MAG: GTP-binding protein [Planctomycetes bacterium RBG_16_64_10]|nr:MAG: GTP-binding protein [Planctomycetes bacterium RBG_16_64_10]
MIDTSSHDDASYQAALASVRHAIDHFKGFSNEERLALARELDQLEGLAEKLASGRVEIVLFGEISTGKSALINALVGREVADVSVQGGWTRQVWRVGWDGCGHCLPGLAQSQVVLVDTPGLNEVDGATRTQMAHDAAARADIILFVTDSDLNDTEYSALVELATSHKPILLVLNKADLYTPGQLEELLRSLTGPRLVGLVAPSNVISAAADPKAVEYVVESADGSVHSEWRRPRPDVESVRRRVLELLRQGGKALVALNGAMYAADKSDYIAALRVQMREERAAATVWSYAVTKSIAVAINPLPAADVLGGTAVDVTMVATLARVYGITLTTANARALVHAILRAAGWVLLGEAVTHVAAALFKGMTLGYGTVLTALPQGAAAGYGSYLVGQAARYYLAHGASWGREAPKTVVNRILDLTDKESVLAQLKEEIRRKIRLNPYVGGAESR